MTKPDEIGIARYLDRYIPLNLKNAEVRQVGYNNHLLFEVTALDGRKYALRMINPDSHRRNEWITMAEEYQLLRVLDKRAPGLGPKAYFLEERYPDLPPLLIQEFVEATCFNDLKPLSREHLVGVASAIAGLHESGITPSELPFLAKRTRYGLGSGKVWQFRLVDALRRAPRRDVATWAARIAPLTWKAAFRVSRCEDLLKYQKPTFHFDGAHAGNTYWRDGEAMFLDWENVSWRNDPSFTLVRFAITAGTDAGEVPEAAFETLVRTYHNVRPVQDLWAIARARLLERQVSDLVWVLWDYARRKDTRTVETGTTVAPRYDAVRKLLRSL